jgi:hypothetical protein
LSDDHRRSSGVFRCAAVCRVPLCQNRRLEIIDDLFNASLAAQAVCDKATGELLSDNITTLANTSTQYMTDNPPPLSVANTVRETFDAIKEVIRKELGIG